MGSPALAERTTLIAAVPSLCTLRRSQSVDLGYDLLALAFQRSEPRQEFSNSGVYLRHREEWRVPTLSNVSLTHFSWGDGRQVYICQQR